MPTYCIIAYAFHDEISTTPSSILENLNVFSSVVYTIGIVLHIKVYPSIVIMFVKA